MSTNSFNHTSLSRRAVLGGTLGAATLALAGCSRASNDPEASQTAGGGNDTFDVIVVGAGSAGVAAARHLKDAGKSVVVLEARNRTGGRLWTDRSIMTVPHERGASLVHGGPDTSTWPWAQKVGLKARKFEQTLSRYNADSPWVPWGNPEFYSFPEGTPKIGLPLPEPKQTETAELYLQGLGIEPSNYPLARIFHDVRVGTGLGL